MGGREQQVRVVGHEYPAKDLHIVFFSTFLQPVGMGREVSVASKQYLSVVAALDDVGW